MSMGDSVLAASILVKLLSFEILMAGLGRWGTPGLIQAETEVWSAWMARSIPIT